MGAAPIATGTASICVFKGAPLMYTGSIESCRHFNKTIRKNADRIQQSSSHWRLLRSLLFYLGWFGRGQTGSSAAQKYFDDNTKYLIIPAKKQKEQMDPKKYHTEGLNEYNIWYDRYVGNVKDNSSLREAAEDRCVLQTDAGYTKADKGTMDHVIVD